MAKKTFKGRPLLPGKLEGKALASKQPFNTSGSYMENLFGGKKDGAPCTDAVNKDFYKKELAGAILCFPTTVGSTMGGVSLMGVGFLGQGPKAMLYAEHADSVSLAGLLMMTSGTTAASSPSICSATSSSRRSNPGDPISHPRGRDRRGRLRNDRADRPCARRFQ